MADKFYRVKKDTFMWDEGAILQLNKDLKSLNISQSGGYMAIDELFHATEIGEEYISANIIENNPEWFERVYPVSHLTKVVYELKDKAKEMLARNYKSDETK